MGPQPLSRVNPKADYHGAYGAGYVDPHPDLSLLAHRVIALAAFGEWQWGKMFGTFLDAAPLPSFAIYQGLESASAKKSILMAAAKTELDPEQYLWLQALHKAVQPVYKVRHQFAHHLWGHSPDIPDGLLLANPIIFLQQASWGAQTVVLANKGQPYDDLAKKVINIDKSKIAVWKRDALEAAAEDMLRAVSAIGHMCEIFLTRQRIDLNKTGPSSFLMRWKRFSDALERLR